ncbi:MAG: DUF4199 domain-containing protein [Bacteroidales bacterium]|nr:MAG: DUF4199 domain-containing protein [Bacteroidales bacterium]
MESKSNPVFKDAMTSGLILGVVQAVIILFVYLMGIDIIRPPFFVTLINYILVIYAIVYATRKYRDELLDGEISYSKALGFGVLVCVFAGIIYGIYMIIHMHFVDTDYLTKFISATEEEYYNAGFSEKQIEDAMIIIGSIQKPIVMVLFTVFGSTMIGTIFSLVTSAFLRRKKSIFVNNQNQNLNS